MKDSENKKYEANSQITNK